LRSASSNPRWADPETRREFRLELAAREGSRAPFLGATRVGGTVVGLACTTEDFRDSIAGRWRDDRQRK
jgi:hypothetical protein